MPDGGRGGKGGGRGQRWQRNAGRRGQEGDDGSASGSGLGWTGGDRHHDGIHRGRGKRTGSGGGGGGGARGSAAATDPIRQAEALRQEAGTTKGSYVAKLLLLERAAGLLKMAAMAAEVHGVPSPSPSPSASSEVETLFDYADVLSEQAEAAVACAAEVCGSPFALSGNTFRLDEANAKERAAKLHAAQLCQQSREAFDWVLSSQDRRLAALRHEALVNSANCLSTYAALMAEIQEESNSGRGNCVSSSNCNKYGGGGGGGEGGDFCPDKLYCQALERYSAAMEASPTDVEVMTNFGDTAVKYAELLSRRCEGGGGGGEGGGNRCCEADSTGGKGSLWKMEEMYGQAMAAYERAWALVAPSPSSSSSGSPTGGGGGAGGRLSLSESGSGGEDHDLAGLLQNWGVGLASMAQRVCDLMVADRLFNQAEEKLVAAVAQQTADPTDRLSVQLALADMLNSWAEKTGESGSGRKDLDFCGHSNNATINNNTVFIDVGPMLTAEEEEGSHRAKIFLERLTRVFDLGFKPVLSMDPDNLEGWLGFADLRLAMGKAIAVAATAATMSRGDRRGGGGGGGGDTGLGYVGKVQAKQMWRESSDAYCKAISLIKAKIVAGNLGAANLSFSDQCSILYNYGCASALAGLPAIAEQALYALRAVGALSLADLVSDPDWDGVRGQTWYQVLAHQLGEEEQMKNSSKRA